MTTHPQIVDFTGALMDRAVLHETGYRQLWGWERIYNLNPAELDANGAGARYAFKLLGPEAHRLAALGDRDLDSGVLRKRPGPEPLATLGLRLICHAATWPAEVLKVIDVFGMASPARVAGGGGIDRPESQVFFDLVTPEGRALWDELAADREYQARRQAVVDAIPSLHVDEHPETLSDDFIESEWEAAMAAICCAVDYARDRAGLDATPRLNKTGA
jgi:hypothetical protein